MLKAPTPARFLGIFGWPLENTLSPAIHNAAFRRTGFDWIYLAFPVPPEDLEAAVAGLRVLGALGGNVTMPHKERVVELLDDISGDARAVGAVNTIQRVGNKLVGHNTDVDGFLQFLSGDVGVDVAEKDVVVLGAGGASRAVVKALDDLNAGRIAIVARTTERAERLAALAVRGASVHEWKEAAGLVESADVVVNATPLGAGGEDAVPEATFRRSQVVVDLVYSPPATPLIERARAAGCEAWGGLGMLVRQAAASFRIWTGQEAPLETMSAAAIHALRSEGESAHD